MKDLLYRRLVLLPVSVVAFVLFFLCSCIENNIPYAKVPLSITAFRVEGQAGECSISKSDMTVKVTLEETVNPKTVKVDTIGYTEKASSSLKEGDVIDLSDNYVVTLSLYQDYAWKIVPDQPIERRIGVSNQVGNAVFNEKYHEVTVYITKNSSLREVELTDLKLGPEGSAMNGVTDGVPPVEWRVYSNYAEAAVQVTFSDFVDEQWTVRVYNSDSNVQVERVDGWVNVAWMYGAGVAGADNGFEYREVGEEEWTTVPQTYLTVDGGRFSARVPHLKANTSYECRAYSGDEKAEAVQFSTVDMGSIPNMDFEDWHQDGKVICPWAEGGSPFWDTGNHGSTTLSENDNVTTPTDEVRPGSAGTTAAKLRSQVVVVKFAAGNLFIGEYKRTKGTNGILGFGREFTSYPTRLKGYFRYQTASITEVIDRYASLKNQPDSCIVWVALGDWDLQTNAESGAKTAVEVETENNGNGRYFDKNDSHVIAYGEMVCGETTGEYRQFDIELEYRATNRKPTALLIICSASKYGDYFVGGPGATMWVDDFSLEYDYDD